MKIIEIVKNAPEGSERYKVFDKEGHTEYYAIINGVKSFYNPIGGSWVSDFASHYDSSLPLPKPKTEWIKIEDSIWDLRPDFETGELYHKFEHARDFTKIENIETLAQAVNQGKCYRKVEKVIDEKEAFIEKVMADHFNRKGLTSEIVGEMFDAGCRFVGE